MNERIRPAPESAGRTRFSRRSRGGGDQLPPPPFFFAVRPVLLPDELGGFEPRELEPDDAVPLDEPDRSRVADDPLDDGGLLGTYPRPFTYRPRGAGSPGSG